MSHIPCTMYLFKILTLLSYIKLTRGDCHRLSHVLKGLMLDEKELVLVDYNFLTFIETTRDFGQTKILNQLLEEVFFTMLCQNSHDNFI